MKNIEGLGFILSKDNLKICANNPSKESAEEEISVEYAGNDLEIGFNISYIQESLSVIHNLEMISFFMVLRIPASLRIRK